MYVKRVLVKAENKEVRACIDIVRQTVDIQQRVKDSYSQPAGKSIQFIQNLTI